MFNKQEFVGSIKSQQKNPNDMPAIQVLRNQMEQYTGGSNKGTWQWETYVLERRITKCWEFNTNTIDTNVFGNDALSYFGLKPDF